MRIKSKYHLNKVEDQYGVRYFGEPYTYEEATLISKYHGRALSRHTSELPMMEYMKGGVPSCVWREVEYEMLSKYTGRTLPLLNPSTGSELHERCLERVRQKEKEKEAEMAKAYYESIERDKEGREGLRPEDRTLTDYLDDIELYGRAYDEDWY